MNRQRLAACLARAVVAAAPAWTPAALAGLGPCLLPALSLAQGKLWMDAAKTIAATADGDHVRVATCPFTGVDYVAPSSSARLTLTDEGGGKWSLVSDGVDDTLVAVWSTPSPAMTLAVGVALMDAGSYPIVVTTTTPRELRFLDTTRRPSITTDQGALDTAAVAAVTLNTPVRLIAACGTTGSSTELYRNGVQAAQDVADTTTTAAITLRVASRTSSTLFLTGRIAAVIASNAKESPATIALIDAYIAALQP